VETASYCRSIFEENFKASFKKVLFGLRELQSHGCGFGAGVFARAVLREALIPRFKVEGSSRS
jgi:hypothetical protein